MMTRVYIAAGSNLGSRKKNIEKAYSLLEKRGIRIVKKSSFYETSPVGPAQRDFINTAVFCRTSWSAHALIKILKSVEKDLGRKKSVRWGPRILDLDVILYGSKIIRSKNLRVPHPHYKERKFVLEPLREIAPNLRPPGSKLTIAQISRKLTDPGQKVKLYKHA